MDDWKFTSTSRDRESLVKDAMTGELKRQAGLTGAVFTVRADGLVTFDGEIDLDGLAKAAAWPSIT